MCHMYMCINIYIYILYLCISYHYHIVSYQSYIYIVSIIHDINVETTNSTYSTPFSGTG